MINKYLEKKVEVNLGENRLEKFYLEYYLLESFAQNDDTTYGIEIVKKSFNEDYEQTEIKDFSYDKMEVIKTLNKLAYNTVTPIEMPFILDDMVGV